MTRAQETGPNRVRIEHFLEQVVIPGRFDELPNFYDGDTLLQHNPLVRDGVQALLEDFQTPAEQGRSLVITKLHRTVAEGEFVFTQSEGLIGSRPAIFYDLWRLDGGKIAEHWDVYQEQPAELPHGNGLF